MDSPRPGTSPAPAAPVALDALPGDVVALVAARAFGSACLPPVSRAMRAACSVVQSDPVLCARALVAGHGPVGAVHGVVAASGRAYGVCRRLVRRDGRAADLLKALRPHFAPDGRAFKAALETALVCLVASARTWRRPTCCLAQALLVAGADPSDALCRLSRSARGARRLVCDLGADTNHADGLPLVRCARHGDAAVMAVLLGNGACARARASLALREAAARGHVQCVTLLLRAGADVHALDDAALLSAAAGGWTLTVRALLGAGARADTSRGGAALLAAIRYQCGSSSSGNSGAAGGGSTAEELLAAGADADAGLGEALLLAAGAGSLALVNLLLLYGASPRARGSGALVLAAKQAHTGVALTLLSYGASASASGSAALQWAACNGDAVLARELLLSGADLHVSCDAPLYLAAVYGRVDMVRLLLDEGACPRRACGGGGAGVVADAGEGDFGAAAVLVPEGDFAQVADLLARAGESVGPWPLAVF